MKKKLYLLNMLAAGLTLAGCNDDLGDGPGNEVLSGDKGYVKIAINLPTTSGQVTRSENDNFDDGSANEYAVNNAYLLLFEGDDEARAELKSWYSISTSFGNVGTNIDNITTQSEVVQQIVKSTDKNTYALVVLNNNENLSFGGNLDGFNSDDAGNTVTIGGASVSTLASLQDALNKEVKSFIGDDKNSFTMTNAPIALIPGTEAPLQGQQSVTTLVELEVFDNEDHANAAVPDEIYVERTVAKVTVGKGVFDETSYLANINASNSQYTGDKVRLDGWYLNVTNRSTKFVRDVSDWQTWASYSNSSANNKNRFFGEISPYRVYWAKDSNYKENWGSTPEDQETKLKEAFHVYAEDDAPYVTENMFYTPVYCLENTMDFDHMMQKETTGIVFKMTYLMDGKEAETLFLIGDPKTSETLDGDGFLAEIGNLSLEFEVDLVAEPKGGYYSTASDMQKLFVDAQSSSLTPEQAEAIVEALAGQQICVYENGATYYYASRIQHFGDYYCEIPNGYVDDVSEYGEEHLGRYGVVRNNWYEILINSISGPGRPTPPDPTDPTDPDNPDPDDPKDDAFINCRINILSWSKRSQNVGL